jgi:hypothetical protein
MSAATFQESTIDPAGNCAPASVLSAWQRAGCEHLGPDGVLRENSPPTPFETLLGTRVAERTFVSAPAIA